MNLATKRRAIGVLILMIIFAWIGLMLFRYRYTHTSVSNKIEKTPPTVLRVPQNIRKEVEFLPQQPIAISKPLISVKTAHARPSNKTQSFTEPPLPSAWVIQLGTFSKVKNAKNLLSKVRHEGYDAYSQTIMMHGKKLTKVFVGPNISYNKICKLQRKIEQRYHLHGIIQNYHVKLPS